MNGKLVGGAILVSAAIAGAAIYYLQVYGFYSSVDPVGPHEIRLSGADGQSQPVPIRDFRGIDADSSPLRFRGCFVLDLPKAELTARYKRYVGAEPLNAPGWFDCFDAGAIAEALEKGSAMAFLSAREVAPGVDRVVAVMDDGRAYVWQQLNATYRD